MAGEVGMDEAQAPFETDDAQFQVVHQAAYAMGMGAAGVEGGGGAVDDLPFPKFRGNGERRLALADKRKVPTVGKTAVEAHDLPLRIGDGANDGNGDRV